MQIEFCWNPCEYLYRGNLTIRLFSQSLSLCIKLQESNAYVNYMKLCVHQQILKLCMTTSLLFLRAYKIVH
jgi:hypothetical protein